MTLDSAPADSTDRAYWYLQGQRDHLPHPAGSACADCWDRFAQMARVWAVLDRGGPQPDAIEHQARQLIELWYSAASTVIAIRTRFDFNPALVPGARA